MRDAANHTASDVYLLEPLADYYSSVGKTLPALTTVAARTLPEPCRRLLAHDNDMTPTLEDFHKQALELRVLTKTDDGATLQRTVVLVGCSDGRPVEFGAIRIHLDAFSADVRFSIRECTVPLGAILRDHGIDHCSDPTAFFTIESDEVIRDALDLAAGQVGLRLCGRHNELSDARGRRLAEVVEILPPVGERH